MSLGPAPDAVAVVGVGNMGAAMALRLRAQGWTVHVHDIDADKYGPLVAAGARACDSPAAAGRGCAAAIVCVVDTGQCEAVLFGSQGLTAALPAGAAVLLCPTIAPADTEALGARLQACGLAVLDTPMSGGPARALDGSMSLMVAGADAVVERHAALLAALSGRVFRLGERIGDGARTKLVNNLLAGINLVGAAEALTMARALGLEPARTLDVIEQSSGQSWIGSDRMRRALRGDDTPRAHMTLLEKDTRLAVQAAVSAGCSGPLGAAAAEVFRQASAAGLADLDDSALLRWLEQRSPWSRPGP